MALSIRDNQSTLVYKERETGENRLSPDNLCADVWKVVFSFLRSRDIYSCLQVTKNCTWKIALATTIKINPYLLNNCLSHHLNASVTVNGVNKEVLKERLGRLSIFLKDCYERVTAIYPSSLASVNFISSNKIFFKLNYLFFDKSLSADKEKIIEKFSSPQGKIQEPQLIFDYSKPFGAAFWAKHFGDVGIEPPLPKNIVEIMQGPCPIWKGKKVSDTHLLVLIPQLVDGRPLSLNLLEELIQKPQTGHSTKYRTYHSSVKNAFGNKSISSSYWVLFSKDVIPGSRSKNYSTQCKLVQELAKKSRVPYEVPTSVEASVLNLMHHVKVGECLYSDDPWTYTRCQEEVDGKYPVVVGGFSSGGFHILYFHYDHAHSGMAVSRKF